MKCSDTPPATWDARVASPFLSSGFALASGQRTLYVDGGTAMALVLLSMRRGRRSRVTRATMYATGATAAFVRDVLGVLAGEEVDDVRVGDANFGLPRSTLERAGIAPVTSFRLALSTVGNDGLFLARVSARRRAALQRSEDEGVLVSRITSEAELEQYCTLPAFGETLPPMALFAILRAMVPKEQAVFLLARHDGRPIAGALYLLSRQRLSCVHEASARAPELTYLQGPTAIIWHAMHVARARAVPSLDLGPVPSSPAAEDAFKREFGGSVETVHHGVVTLTRRTRGVSDLLRPAWQRLVALGGLPRRGAGAA